MEEFRLVDGGSVFASQIGSLAAAMSPPQTRQASSPDVERQMIQPMRRSALQGDFAVGEAALGAHRALTLRSPMAAMRLDTWVPVASGTTPPAHSHAALVNQLQSLVSAMAVFNAYQGAGIGTDRQTILPMRRPEPMWGVPAVM